MKKRGSSKQKKQDKIHPILICLILIALIAFILVFKSLILTTNVIQNHLTPKVIENPPTPENCSNESIKKVWEFIFKGSSENLTIIYPSQQFLEELKNESITPLIFNEVEFGKEDLIIGGCPIYTAYQINGSNLKMISGINRELLFGTYGPIIIALNGKFGPSMIEQIKNISYNSLDQETNVELEWSSEDYYENETNIYNRETNITSIEQAKSYFESIFNLNTSGWIGEEEESMYGFYENKTAENITLFGESINIEKEFMSIGYVFGDLEYDTYMYTEYSLFGVLEYLKEKYQNWSSPINTSLNNIEIKVNNSKLELLKNYESLQRLEIKEGNQIIIETEVNFSEEIDLTKIILKKQESNSTRGYVIINGLNYTKNITVDRLSNKSESVCIKDKDIYSIEEISSECNAIDEYILECPGNLTSTAGNFTCNISGNKLVITGLKHSAILEIIPPEIPCVQNWQCDEWSEFSKSCGYRTCTDLNNCGNVTGKPLEYQECPVCIPDWKCTSYLPEKCPREEKRTRTCTDVNDCGTEQGKPELTQTCERKNILIYFLIFLLGAAVIALIIIILKRIIVRREKLKERPKTEQGYYKDDPNYPSQVEQYYGSDQTYNFKAQPKTNPQSQNSQENKQEKFPDKYWPK